MCTVWTDVPIKLESCVPYGLNVPKVLDHVCTIWVKGPVTPGSFGLKLDQLHWHMIQALQFGSCAHYG